MDIALNLLKSQITQQINAKAIEIPAGGQKRFNFTELVNKVDQQSNKAKKEANKLDRSIEAFFIGPRGENIQYFTYLINKAITSHLSARVEYQTDDSRHITRRMKNQNSFLDAQDRLQRALNLVLTKMKDLTPPFFSSRYFGHMIWETTIPSIVGNFATLLYNPNNCAFQASPLTTILQIQVMTQFAKMFRYPPMLSLTKQNSGLNSSWGHLTCGGTVANCEAFWAARNCKFLALSVRKYLQNLKDQKNLKVEINNIAKAKQIKIFLANGTQKKLLDLSAWELLNISNECASQAYDSVYKTLYPGDDSLKPQNYAVYQQGVAGYSIGKIGLVQIYDWLEEISQSNPQKQWKNNRIPRMKVFVSATAHYSIRKSISLLGLGQKSVQKLIVDLDSRVCIKNLNQKLQNCLDNKIPVLAIAGIIGTTEESTVDDISQIFKLKTQFSKKGLYFHFHVDGAYGGYFASMTQSVLPSHWNSYSQYVQRQLFSMSNADSITFDPHKTGYVPYSCGGIIYKNHRLRDNLSFSAPYIYTGTEPNMSIYGIEGSKPGSSVTSVYLSLQVLPLVRGGHGQLLERTMMNTKIFTAGLYRIKQIDIKYEYGQGKKLQQRFECFLLPRLLWQKNNDNSGKQFEQKAIQKISEASPQTIQQIINEGIQGKSFSQIYKNLGPDLNIVCYGLNFFDTTTNKPNRSLKKYNQFNRTLIKLSKPVGTDISVRMKDLYVSETQINKHSYGKQIFEDFLRRHNLEDEGQQQLVLIRSTIMNAFFTEAGQDSGKVGSSNKLFISQLLENGCETLLHLKWR